MKSLSPSQKSRRSANNGVETLLALERIYPPASQGDPEGEMSEAEIEELDRFFSRKEEEEDGTDDK